MALGRRAARAGVRLRPPTRALDQRCTVLCAPGLPTVGGPGWSGCRRSWIRRVGSHTETSRHKNLAAFVDFGRCSRSGRPRRSHSVALSNDRCRSGLPTPGLSGALWRPAESSWPGSHRRNAGHDQGRAIAHCSVDILIRRRNRVAPGRVTLRRLVFVNLLYLCSLHERELRP